MRDIRMGTQDFKKVRDSDWLYVDKTGLIHDVLFGPSEVTLFTRPRRFGKSMNLSMLDAFFNLEYPEDNTWFDGLVVTKCPKCMAHKNKYPVIHMDLRGIGVTDVDEFIRDLAYNISSLYQKYEYLLDSDTICSINKKDFEEYRNGDANPISLRWSLLTLSKMLEKYHGQRVVILVDEYDDAIQNAFGTDVQEFVLKMIGDILSRALKGNDSLEFAVITGVTQIPQESIFSGFNNIIVNNIFSSDSDDCFGFTETEVKGLLDEYERPDKLDEIRSWYDGYRFGDADLYNPWSILRYVSNGFKPGKYWASTSKNEILGTLLENADEDVFDNLRTLSQGGTIFSYVDPAVTFDSIMYGSGNIYSMMLVSGYLTAVSEGGGYRLSIPNMEMYKVFGHFLDCYTKSEIVPPNNTWDTDKLSEAIINNRTDEVGSLLYELFSGTLGSAMLVNEHVYQAFITGLLMELSGLYRVTAEFESGNGRYDIMLERRSGEGPNVLIELKRCPMDANQESAESMAYSALEQIRQRDYTHGLTGRTLIYGIAFRGKNPVVVSDILEISG
ncbi:MAG: AAA family ATPase [Candidatus Methanomethylophilaceae archaeon]|nr:AAA family ATPase [Candidatus Methanomethylophilaceae archaeon]